MLSKAILRVLIAGEVVLVIGAMAASLLGRASLPEALRSYEDGRSADPSTAEVLLLILPLVWLLAGRGVAWIGLFVFWRPARMWYLVTTVGGLATVPFFGPYVETGWTYALSSAGQLVGGFVLALIYCSPLKELYARKPRLEEAAGQNDSMTK